MAVYSNEQADNRLEQNVVKRTDEDFATRRACPLILRHLEQLR
jgi:hypothetical protein